MNVRPLHISTHFHSNEVNIDTAHVGFSLTNSYASQKLCLSIMFRLNFLFGESYGLNYRARVV